jgi:hypothetical protein
MKVGDKVAVYFCSPSQAMPHRVVCRIMHIFPPLEQYPPDFTETNPDVFQVSPLDYEEWAPSYVHPKQCRLIKDGKYV